MTEQNDILTASDIKKILSVMEKKNIKKSPFYEFINNSNISQNLSTRLFRNTNDQKNCANFRERYLFVDESNVAVETVTLHSPEFFRSIQTRIGVRAVGNKVTLCYLDSFVMCDVDFTYRCERYGEIYDHVTMYRIFTKTVQYASNFPNLVKSESAVSVRSPKGMHIYFETSDTYNEAEDWDKMANFLRLICDANYVIRWCLDRTRGFCDKIYEVGSNHAKMASDPTNQLFAGSQSGRVKELLFVRACVAKQFLEKSRGTVSQTQQLQFLVEALANKKHNDDNLKDRMEKICVSSLNVLHDLTEPQIRLLNRYSFQSILKILTAYKPVTTFVEDAYLILSKIPEWRDADTEKEEYTFLNVEIPNFFRNLIKSAADAKLRKETLVWPKFPNNFDDDERRQTRVHFSDNVLNEFYIAKSVWKNFTVSGSYLKSLGIDYKNENKNKNKPLLRVRVMQVADQLNKKWENQNDLKLLHVLDPNMRVSPVVMEILNDEQNIFDNKTEQETSDFCGSLTKTDKEFFLSKDNPLQGMYTFRRFADFLKLTENLTVPNLPIITLFYFADKYSCVDLIKHYTMKNVSIMQVVQEVPILRNIFHEKIPQFTNFFHKRLPLFRKSEGKSFEDSNDYSSLDIKTKSMLILRLYSLQMEYSFVTGLHALLVDFPMLENELKSTTEKNAFYDSDAERFQPRALKMVVYDVIDVNKEYTQPWSSPVNLTGRFIRDRTKKVIHVENALVYGLPNQTDEEKANNFPFILMNSAEKTIDQLFMFHFINDTNGIQSLKSSQEILELFFQYRSEFEEIAISGGCFEFMNRSIQERLTNSILPVITSEMPPMEKAIKIQERQVKEACRLHVPIDYDPKDLSRHLMLRPEKFLEYVLNKHNGENLEKQIGYTCEEGCDSSVRLYKHDGHNILESVCEQAPHWCREFGEKLDETFDESHEKICEEDANELTKDVRCSKTDDVWYCT